MSKTSYHEMAMSQETLATIVSWVNGPYSRKFGKWLFGTISYNT